MQHKEIYQQLSLEEKEAFFQSALEKYQELREEFIRQFEAKGPTISGELSYSNFCGLIEQERKSWVAAFEELDFENPDWE
ncbi:MAG: hypothetical protein U1C46_00640, partial [Bacteroidales bacterium]|nr:hypothetical protein [Bacteroidales bacterium]